MTLTEYKLDFGWLISFPSGWTMEESGGEYTFFPDGEDTTAYATVFHAEKDGQSAPEQLMRAAFLRTIPEGAEQLPFSSDSLPSAVFGCAEDKVYRVCGGFWAEGELLSLNIYAWSRTRAMRLFPKIYSTVGLIR